jgi:hypothetical protein
MPHHFTKSTVMATFRCPKCNRDTPHHVHDGRRGGCMVCIAKVQPEQKPPPARQEEMFR